jgi:hypothetical protein
LATQDAHAGDLPVGVLVRKRGQWPERRAIKFLEGTAARTRQLPEGLAVQAAEQVRDRPVRFSQTEEALLAQPGENPSLDQEHTPFDLGLIVSQQLLVVMTVARP